MANGVSQVALVVKNPSSNAGNTGDSGSIPGLGGSPGGAHGNPLQYSHGQRNLEDYRGSELDTTEATLHHTTACSKQHHGT